MPSFADRLHLVEATTDDLDRIMDLKRQGVATFPLGSLMAWRGEDCVGRAIKLRGIASAQSLATKSHPSPRRCCVSSYQFDSNHVHANP